MTIKRVFETRNEWLAARREAIGASESPAILGVGYADQNPLTVYESKVNPQPAEEPDERMTIGSAMEPVLRTLLSHVIDQAIAAPAWVMWQHEDHEWLACTPDGWTENDELVELKNVGSFAAGEWAHGDIPLQYMVQCQHQLLVTGAEVCHLFALIGGQSTEYREVKPNAEFHEWLLTKLLEFWLRVQNRQVPDVDHSAATAKFLSRLHPDDNGRAIYLPQAASQWITVLDDAKVQIKRAESLKRLAENNLKACLGDNTYGVTPQGNVVSWKTTEKKEHTVRATKFRALRQVKQVPKGTEVEMIEFDRNWEPIEQQELTDDREK